jgi:hypothetical protein
MIIRFLLVLQNIVILITKFPLAQFGVCSHSSQPPINTSGHFGGIQKFETFSNQGDFPK